MRKFVLVAVSLLAGAITTTLLFCFIEPFDAFLPALAIGLFESWGSRFLSRTWNHQLSAVLLSGIAMMVSSVLFYGTLAYYCGGKRHSGKDQTTNKPSP